MNEIISILAFVGYIVIVLLLVCAIVAVIERLFKK